MKNTLNNVPTDKPSLFIARGTRRSDGTYATALIECVGLKKAAELARQEFEEFTFVPHLHLLEK